MDRLVAAVVPGDPCEAARAAVEASDEALATLEQNLGQAQDDAAVLGDPSLTTQEKLDRLGQGGDPVVEREIDNQEAELAQAKAEQNALEEAQDSTAGWVVNQWAKTWRWLALIALVALLLPGAMRIVSYFLLMPWVHRVHKPIHLSEGYDSTTAALRTSDAQRTLPIELGAGEVLSARSEHVRPVQGTIRSRLLYDWGSPFISFAAGLYGLSRVTGDEAGSSATLSTPDDPNAYLMRIDFTEHPGLVMHPKHVVGVIGEPELTTRWRWGIQSFATWQVRYIMFAGTGSLIVEGSGDVVATNPGGRSTRMEQNLVMGFDSRLSVGVNRTEVFWPYLWRQDAAGRRRVHGGPPALLAEVDRRRPQQPDREDVRRDLLGARQAVRLLRPTSERHACSGQAIPAGASVRFRLLHGEQRSEPVDGPQPGDVKERTFPRSAARAARVSQSELARAAAVSQPNLSAYENGRRAPSPEVLVRISRAIRSLGAACTTSSEKMGAHPPRGDPS